MLCLDDDAPSTPAAVARTMLHGTYAMRDGVQVGSLTNRWYDKMQIIVCANGSAGGNFEHTSVDGHTVLRYRALAASAFSLRPSASTTMLYLLWLRTTATRHSLQVRVRPLRLHHHALRR